ncbi:hypothetical protein SS1G_00916 [Sclerotinia sclerotiorum 1980 UF-70]|uniref:Reverse transcriptase domain-containing protein n=1 Tax=Sclerotinia sclerotiorum (strain ATCC 18683 / 1980 / Ss-1) TaxID=665079 RepID=A7E6J1_SCLS1|nr:hypothetical protein SS1G_00916 [Sclerotinia sclerotiorum 1980 UF-70]EDN91513.1 hypothetical protein SS1G_00916 [Sclerotinia sclerotiorum 1980 UF-70]
MATPSPPNLSKTLSDKASNLLNKVNDAQSIFNPVTQLLDTYLGSEEVRALPPSSRKLLTSLCLEFKATIEQHFDAFVTGHPPPRGATTPPEPYIYKDTSRKITKTHPFYEIFTPLDDWKENPRVLTYIRKEIGIQINQIRPIISRDLIFIQLISTNNTIFTIINIYNAPTQCTDGNQAIKALFELQNFPNNAILLGDFNLHHPNWNPLHPSPSTLAEPFVEWSNSRNLHLISPIGTPTHSKGNVLDLTFLSGPYTAYTALAEQLECTSDHSTLKTYLHWNYRSQKPAKKLKLNTLNETLFKDLLETNLTNIAAIPRTPSLRDLDQAASSLTQALTKAYTGSARRSINGPLQQPWWNKDCIKAVYKHRITNTPTSKRSLRKTVRKAKHTFYITKVDKVEDINDPRLTTSHYTNPRSYRPIALLSVLGKGLERLIAKKVSWLALNYQVLANQQLGALPLRSSVDLTTCVTHDIEASLKQGLKTTLLTMDVKGAFDAVLPGRLVNRLREQGWPNNLVRWVQSFATNRSIKIRLDGETGPETKLECGLPQGSPISPILFMLYIAPLFWMGKPQSRFGYADDIAILATSNSLQTNCDSLKMDMQETLEWGKTEGITFDPKKSELIHFYKGHRTLTDTPAIHTGSMNIEVKPGPLKWLGVHFDRKLCFKPHVQILAAKALKGANALRSLSNTHRGIPPYLTRKVAEACILKKCYFASETWWPGRTRTKKNALNNPISISNVVDSHLSLLNKVVITCTRAILPVYKTTNTAVLYEEAKLRPSEIELNLISQLYAARTTRLDLYHPLRIRAENITKAREYNRTPDTRFARLITALPETEHINPLAFPPWEIRESRAEAEARINGPMGRTKAQAAEDFKAFHAKIPRSDIQIFSDGSKSESKDGATGGGFVISQFDIQIAHHSFSLGTNAEVFDAEATAAVAGAAKALTLASTKLATDLWIFLDNHEAALRLGSHFNGSSQRVFEDFLKLTQAWAVRPRLPHTSPGKIRVRWVPGHLDIPGNEIADKAAKEGTKLPFPLNPICTLASLKRMIRTRANKADEQLWNTVSPQYYKDLQFNHTSNTDTLSLKRATLHHILAIRSQHGDFAAYHERFNHTTAHVHCSCGKRKTPLHFFFCKKGKAFKALTKSPPSEAIPWLLRNPTGIAKLAEWLEYTKFYTKICPWHTGAR